MSADGNRQRRDEPHPYPSDRLQVNLKMTRAELDALDLLAEAAGVGRSELIRRKVLGGKRPRCRLMPLELRPYDDGHG